MDPIKVTDEEAEEMQAIASKRAAVQDTVDQAMRSAAGMLAHVSNQEAEWWHKALTSRNLDTKAYAFDYDTATHLLEATEKEKK